MQCPSIFTHIFDNSQACTYAVATLIPERARTSSGSWCKSKHNKSGAKVCAPSRGLQVFSLSIRIPDSELRTVWKELRPVAQGADSIHTSRRPHQGLVAELFCDITTHTDA